VNAALRLVHLPLGVTQAEVVFPAVPFNPINLINLINPSNIPGGIQECFP
jgi:hypothetical protein